jgi:hypothetical protein
MLMRAIALSLALLIGIGALVPLATQETEAGPRKARKNRKHVKKYKKYSKGWWRQYRARQKKPHFCPSKGKLHLSLYCRPVTPPPLAGKQLSPLHPSSSSV